jgi:transcriptional regulator with XRE-family HTH domain
MPMEYNQKDLGQRLKEALEEKKSSQREFAECLNLSESYILRIINGKAAIIIDSLDKACKILNKSPDYLMYGIQR